ncbi:hypothetical protein [Acidisoma cladoniae]|uniref:hypothetical protein n=1 Tax=Acidisoma cladoniae TaxID=3040935 RepID=UPI00254BAFC2|nr:hypothetical protein [Acidisoma sp. PAMC 29798]
MRAAEWLLWAWTAWTAIAGIYQSLATIPKMIATQLGGLISISQTTVDELIVFFYLLTAAFSAWAVWEIGLGRRWARTGFLLNFIIDAMWTFAPPYHGYVVLLWAAPDLGLQAVAIYMLYSSPGRYWFEYQLKLRSHS